MYFIICSTEEYCAVLSHSVGSWLCNPMNCSLPGSSSVMGILQARILKWVAMPAFRGSSWPRDWTQVCCIAGGFFTVWATREAQEYCSWVAYPFSRGSSWPKNQTRVSCIAGGFFTSWATREAPVTVIKCLLT